MNNEINVLHVTKWYPHKADPQNGIFVQKHIESTGVDPVVIGFLSFSGKPEISGNTTIYGAKQMSNATKLAIFTAAIAQHKPRVVHFHCFAPDLLPLLLYAKSKRIKTLHTEHGSAFLKHRLHLLKGWRKKAPKWYFSKVDLVLPISPLLEEGIRALSPKATTRLLPNIVTPFTSSITEERLTKQFCVVADVVFATKQQDKIVEVFRKIPRAKAELHFFGGGPDLRELEERCRKDSNIFVHGRKTNPEVLELLPKFDALVLYSAYETFGITIFEARQAGLWAIHSSGLGGQPWYDDGCLEVSSEEELLIAMNQVLNLEAASKAAFPDLSPLAIGGMLKDLYREIVLKS